MFAFAQTTAPALLYTAIELHIPISGHVVSGNRAAKQIQPQERQRTNSHTRPPWADRTLHLNARLPWEERRAH